VKLTTRRYLVLPLRLRGAIPMLPHTPSIHVPLIMHRDTRYRRHKPLKREFYLLNTCFGSQISLSTFSLNQCIVLRYALSNYFQNTRAVPICLRVFGNRVLRNILGRKWDRVIGEWRRLIGEELRDLHSSENIIRAMKTRRMRWVEHVARMGHRRGAYRVLVVRPEGKRPLGRPRRKWEDNRRGMGDTEWIDLARDRDRWRAVVFAVMNLRVL